MDTTEILAQSKSDLLRRGSAGNAAILTATPTVEVWQCRFEDIARRLLPASQVPAASTSFGHQMRLVPVAGCIRESGIWRRSVAPP